jgi:HAD superfamily hydrolase (TIGR01509 family)
MGIPHPISFQKVPTLKVLLEAFPGVSTLLFDMDGTLFDTEKYHTLALQSIGREHKIVPPFGPKEVHAMMMGKADHLLFEIIKDWPTFPKHWTAKDFVHEKNRHLLELLASVDGSTYLNVGIPSLLEEALKKNMNVGLVTSSEKVVTMELLAQTKLAPIFSYVLTRDDSLKVKPDPWPYLKAISHFNVTPSETLIFEDSNVGLEAARNSGAHVVKAEWYF